MTRVEHEGGRSIRRHPLVAITGMVLVARALLTFIGTIASRAIDPSRPAANLAMHTSLEARREHLSSWRPIHLWFNWDAQHYERLSDVWFHVHRHLVPNVVTPTGGRAWDEFSWPPLYAVLVGLVHRITFVPAAWVMVVGGLVLQIAFLWLAYRLAIAEGDDADGAMVVVLVSLAMPFAFFLGTPLTEPLFAVLAIGALLAHRRGRWVIACALAAALPWTKSAGVLVTIPLAVAAFEHVRRTGERVPAAIARAIAPAAACAASYLGFLGFSWLLTGDALAAIHTQRYGWGNSTGNPIVELVRGIDRWQYLAVGVLLVLAVAIAVRRWITWADASFAVVMLLAATAVPTIVPAAPRYASLAFPIAFGLARWARARGVVAQVVGALAVLQGGLFALWATYWLGVMF